MSDRPTADDYRDRIMRVLAELRERPCENYDEPGKNCATAGPAVLLAEGCSPCIARLAAAWPAPVVDVEELAERIRSEANEASRPGQMGRLNSLADEVSRLAPAVDRETD